MIATNNKKAITEKLKELGVWNSIAVFDAYNDEFFNYSVPLLNGKYVGIEVSDLFGTFCRETEVSELIEGYDSLAIMIGVYDRGVLMGEKMVFTKFIETTAFEDPEFYIKVGEGELYEDEDETLCTDIMDAEGDEFKVYFDNDGAARIECETTYITLTKENLSSLHNLIEQAEQSYADREKKNE
jgi:hypothetical protein